MPKDEDTTVYRGIKLTEEEIEYYRPYVTGTGDDGRISMRGYTSTSRSEEEALKFALHLKKKPGAPVDNRIPVLMVMTIGRDTNHFRVNGLAYTDFPKEEEILLRDGEAFTVDALIRDAPVTYKGKPYTVTKMILGKTSY